MNNKHGHFDVFCRQLIYARILVRTTALLKVMPSYNKLLAYCKKFALWSLKSSLINNRNVIREVTIEGWWSSVHACRQPSS